MDHETTCVVIQTMRYGVSEVSGFTGTRALTARYRVTQALDQAGEYFGFALW